MTDYVNVPISTDPNELLSVVYGYIQDRIDGWEPSLGNFEVILAEAFAEVAAELRELATDVPTTIFRYYGTHIASIPPIDATLATGITTWTMRDTAGYFIPAGTHIALTAPDGTPIGFSTVTDTTIAPLSSTASINVIADEPGASGTGLSGTAQMIDSLDFVQSVTVVGSTADGIDAEEDTVYLGRLVDTLRLQSPRPILADDFATFATTIAGVDRAVAIDLYDAGTSTPNTPGAITVGVVDAFGAPVSTTIKNEVQAALAGDDRVANIEVFVVDPTTTQVDVDFDVKVLPGFDPTFVHDAVVDAITSFLSPETWGTPPNIGAGGWINSPTVRITDIARVILLTDGVAYLNAAPTVALHGGTLGSVDVTLPGVVPLASAGTITGVAAL